MIKQEQKDTIYNAIFSDTKALDGASKAVLLDWQVGTMLTLDLYATDTEIEDMLGFIQWSKDNGQNSGFIAANLMHDINGIRTANNPGFSPRTAGYSKFLTETVSQAG